MTETRRHLSSRGLENLRAARARTRERRIEECRAVCNEPFRRRYQELRSEHRVTPDQLARDMGWTTTGRAPGATRGDTVRLHRALGVLSRAPDRRGVAGRTYQKTLSYEVAERLAGLLGLDPTECGL